MTEKDLLHNINDRLGWYLEAKFGLFIHWGAYSVGGVEASWPIMAPDLAEVMFGTRTKISEAEYTHLPLRFNPVEFDAEAWVRTAWSAGMRYIVFTAKHHDGFCMFDAPGTDYKITNTPFGRDVCLELSQACADAGMPLGFYYSPPDMHHPGYRDTRKLAVENWLGEPKRLEWADYLDTMENQLRKLLTGYGEVRILWFDGLVNHAKYNPPRFHKMIHELSPHTLINDRLGDGYDFITPEQFIPSTGIPVRTGKPPSSSDPAGERLFRSVIFLYKIPILRGALARQLSKYAEGDLELSTVQVEPFPSPDRFQPWETCMTMGKSWAYNPDEIAWKEPRKLIRNLVEVVSGGGNYLLNVGPTARGTFPVEAIQRLQEVGRWLACYRDGIYNTTYTPIERASWGRTTRQGNRLFLHIFDWPVGNLLEIDPFPGRVMKVSLFSGELLAFSHVGSRLVINLPKKAPDPNVSVIVVAIDHSETTWSAFSQPSSPEPGAAQYLRSQVLASAVINAGINGIIAFFAYRSRGFLTFSEILVDILITVAIISFLVSWIAVILAEQQLDQGKITGGDGVGEVEIKSGRSPRGFRLPRNSALRALAITLGCVLIFGGMVLGGLLFLLSPDGMGNWTYIWIKTLYTGLCAALAAGISIYSVFKDISGGKK